MNQECCHSTAGLIALDKIKGWVYMYYNRSNLPTDRHQQDQGVLDYQIHQTIKDIFKTSFLSVSVLHPSFSHLF
jgi:hypothetical protein